MTPALRYRSRIALITVTRWLPSESHQLIHIPRRPIYVPPTPKTGLESRLPTLLRHFAQSPSRKTNPAEDKLSRGGSRRTRSHAPPPRSHGRKERQMSVLRGEKDHMARRRRDKRTRHATFSPSLSPSGGEPYLFAFVLERLWPSSRGASTNDGPRRSRPLVNHGTEGERAADISRPARRDYRAPDSPPSRLTSQTGCADWELFHN